MHLWTFRAAFIFRLIGRRPPRQTEGLEWARLIVSLAYSAPPSTTSRRFGVGTAFVEMEIQFMAITLFTITHKQFTPPSDPLYMPLHVGRKNSVELGFLGDHIGDTISERNPFYCELTGMYWIWKNYSNSDYVGICHYRRYLINEQGALYTEAELSELLKHYDMITTKLLTLPGSYYEGFSANHHIKDLLTTGEVLKQKYPDYYDTFKRLIHGPHTYFGNIFITSKKEYDRYCEWLFTILFEVEKRTDFTGYNGYQKRLFGFLSEFLQTVWIKYHNLNVKECMVGMVGEKYETRLLKEKLASFFEKRDYQGAEKHFMECYQKRPDILMEASDVNGELRLCMQIISTCKFEDEAYGKCILDTFCDYPNLIRHFGRLNSAVIARSNNIANKEAVDFLETTRYITPVSIAIAEKIFLLK